MTGAKDGHEATIRVPETVVGVATMWSNDDGTLGAAWRDVDGRVPVELGRAAAALRKLADAMEELGKDQS